MLMLSCAAFNRIQKQRQRVNPNELAIPSFTGQRELPAHLKELADQAAAGPAKHRSCRCETGPVPAGPARFFDDALAPSVRHVFKDRAGNRFVPIASKLRS